MLICPKSANFADYIFAIRSFMNFEEFNFGMVRFGRSKGE